MPEPRIIVLTAPSGAGKSTIAKRVMQEMPALRFSVSATTRAPRAYEKDGVHYHFLSPGDFQAHIDAGEMLEYEEVYPGRLYGTLRAEVERATREAPVLLDIEVKGAFSVKKAFGEDALLIFIRPPSLEVLEERLRGRDTENEDSLKERLARATMEMDAAPRCDIAIENDALEPAVRETLRAIRQFLVS